MKFKNVEYMRNGFLFCVSILVVGFFVGRFIEKEKVVIISSVIVNFFIF